MCYKFETNTDEESYAVFLELIKDLVEDSEYGFYRVWNCGNCKTSKSIHIDILKQSEEITSLLKYYSPRNLMISFNGFTKPKCYAKNNLHHVKAFCIDVDYKRNPKLKGVEPLEIWEKYIRFICDEYIPKPNYIEYSNQLRLIYIFKERISITNSSVIPERITSYFTAQINQFPFEYHVFSEPQKLNTYLRVPCGYNSKNDAIVRLKKITDFKYTFQELLNFYLPELEDWYPTWKEKQKTPRRKKSKKKTWNLDQVNRNRISDLEKIQQYLGNHCNGYRFKMCLLYYIHQKNLDPNHDHENAVAATLHFNSNFSFPLLEKEITSKLGANKNHIYQYRNKTIIEELGLTDSMVKKLELSLGGNHMSNAEKCQRYRNRVKKEKEKLGKTKKQKKEKRDTEILKLRQAGVSVDEICKKMKCGKSTVYNAKK